jgi:hypothetical protein
VIVNAQAPVLEEERFEEVFSSSKRSDADLWLNRFGLVSPFFETGPLARCGGCGVEHAVADGVGDARINIDANY